MIAKSDHFAVETGRNLLLTIGFINGWVRKTAANIHLVPDRSKTLDAESVETIGPGLAPACSASAVVWSSREESV